MFSNGHNPTILTGGDLLLKPSNYLAIIERSKHPSQKMNDSESCCVEVHNTTNGNSNIEFL